MASDPLAQFTKRTVTLQPTDIVRFLHRFDGFLIRYRDREGKTLMQLHLPQKQTDGFGSRKT